MNLDSLCRLCGIFTNKLIENESLFEKIQFSLVIKLGDHQDLHKKICSSCEQKLFIIEEFLQLVVETQKKLKKILQAKHEQEEIELINKNNNINLIKAKIDKLPNIRIQKITTKKNEIQPTELSSPKNQVEQILEKLSNKTNVTISKVQSKKHKNETIQVFNDTTEISQDYCNSTDFEEHLEDVDENEITIYEENNDQEIIEIGDETMETIDNMIKEEPMKINKDKYQQSDEDYQRKCDERSQKTRQYKYSRVTVVQMDTPAAYVCMTCKEKFPSFEPLKQHMQTNQKCKSVLLTCEVCSKVCDNKKALYQHSLTHRTKNTYVCDECGKSYSNRFNLENHKSSFHGKYVEEFGNIYKCKACDQQFTNRKDLYTHIQTHKKETNIHLCDICGKCFNYYDILRSHKRIHLDIRPHECNLCDKKFRTKVQLTQHLNSHTGVKEFTCVTCKKAYAKKTSLIQHMRLHTGEMPYQCNICQLKFNSPNKLQTHAKRHSSIVEPTTVSQ